MSDRPEDLQNEVANIPQFKYDVFIIFATDDDKLARCVCTGLENISLRCMTQFKHDAFQIGQNVFDNIIYNVTHSNVTLLLLTEKSLKSNWVTLETILALEESQRSNILRLRMLLHNVREGDIEPLKRGILASVPHITVDFNKNEWRTQLAWEIRREISMPDLLPVGSMAHGLVFSHYTGFLCHVLPVLKDEIRKTKIFERNCHHVSMKYYMLLSETCNIYDDLSSEDNTLGIKIEKEETLKFERSHAGKIRTFSLCIYKITKGNEEYYFFADFPHVLKAMFKMENDHLAEVDIRFQIARFYYTMNEMINHAENSSCNNTVELLRFNENFKSMQNVLWLAVSSSVPTEVYETMTADINNLQIQQPLQNFCDDPSTNNCEVDATVSCYTDCEADCDIALTIEAFLKENGKTVECATKRHSNMHLEKANWHIFVFSKEALGQSFTLTMNCMAALADSLNDNALRVLVVLRDVDPRHIPRLIKCVVMLKVTEPNYCSKILNTMDGAALRMEHSLPAGDVATGLAWAYVINYLTITLLCPSSERLGFRDRIQEFLRKKNISCGCILKMYIILPRSCTTTQNIAEKANESCAVGVRQVEKLGSLEPVRLNTGGQLSRPFYLQMYKHRDPISQRSVCFISEYCTPANCMREMVENFKFAGLHETEMGKQCEDFVNILPDIMQREAVKKGLGDISSLVQLMYYDDKSETLLSAIGRHIQTAGQEIVYATDHPRTGDPNYHLPSM